MKLMFQTTGLTGILVSEYPHRSLNILYGKILRALDKLPQDYPYRTTTEKLIKERATIVKDVSHNIFFFINVKKKFISKLMLN